MKKILALVILLFTAVYQVQAIPAYPHPVKYQLPDGTSVTVRIFGDEFMNYMLTSDGYHVTGLEDGYLYYYTPGVGTRSVESMRVSEPSHRSAEERRYVSSLRPGVDQTYIQARIAVATERRASMAVNKVGEYAPFMSQTAKNTASRALAARSLVILCQFQDVKFQTTTTRSTFDNMLNQEGYSENGSLGSARDYFLDNSLGKYNPHFDVSQIVTLSNDMAFYGKPASGSSDGKPREMVREACKLASESGTDFSLYDANNDGIVDDIFVIYAGYNEAEGGPANSIWPHRWYLNIGSSDLSIVLNGKTVDGYACTSELSGASGKNVCGIGTFCHEFGHVLGLPDFYDADYTSNGLTVGLYDVCVMSSGGYNGSGKIPPHYTGLERNLVGWNEMKDIIDADLNLTVHPIHTELGNDVWRIETGNEGEYFYIEARQATSWDQTLSSQGLLIYHIDRSDNIVSGQKAINRWAGNSLNNIGNHPCARLIESSGSTTSNGKHSLMFYPGSNGTISFLPGNPKFRAWNGDPLQVGLTAISQSNGTVSLRVVKDLDLGTLQGVVTDVNGTPIAATRISLVEIEEAPASQSSNLRLVAAPSAQSPSRAAKVVHSVITDIQGKYILTNLPYAKYSVMMECDGFDAHVETIELTEKNYKLDVTLNRFVAQLLSQLSWAKGQIKGYLDMEQSLWVASMWDAADLSGVVGKKLGGVSVETGSFTSYEVRLLVNKQLKYTSKGSTIKGGQTLIYLPSQLDIPITASDNVRIEFNVASAISSIAMDGGPAVEGKGNLYSLNGSSWDKLSALGIAGNLKMAMLYRKDSDIPDMPSAVTTPSQRTCTISFSTTDGNITMWNLRYKSATGEWSEWKEIKTSSYVLTDLTPNTTYDVELKALFADKASEAKAFQFTTTDLTSQFAAIGGVKAHYAVGESYTLDYVNTQSEVESVEWRWNNGAIRSESIVFAIAGKGRLDCIITYKDGTKEMLSRQIIVQ